MYAKISVFVICVEAIIYFLLHNLQAIPLNVISCLHYRNNIRSFAKADDKFWKGINDNLPNGNIMSLIEEVVDPVVYTIIVVDPVVYTIEVVDPVVYTLMNLLTFSLGLYKAHLQRVSSHQIPRLLLPRKLESENSNTKLLADLYRKIQVRV